MWHCGQEQSCGLLGVYVLGVCIGRRLSRIDDWRSETAGDRTCIRPNGPGRLQPRSIGSGGIDPLSANSSSCMHICGIPDQAEADAERFHASITVSLAVSLLRQRKGSGPCPRQMGVEG